MGHLIKKLMPGDKARLSIEEPPLFTDISVVSIYDDMPARVTLYSSLDGRTEELEEGGMFTTDLKGRRVDVKFSGLERDHRKSVLPAKLVFRAENVVKFHFERKDGKRV